jgi:hypothetical protein
MQWWNDFLTWFSSSAGWRVFSTAILPFIAIIVAALLAAWIGRASARRVLEHQDRELKSAAIMALIGAGRKAAIWTSLGTDEKQHVDSLISEADIRVRLLPVNGANAAADWAAHELGAMKKNSATFSFQAEQTFIDYRDRLLEWQDKPKRARKLFAFDLDQWRYDDDSAARAAAPATTQEKWDAKAPESPPAVAPTTTAQALAAAPPPVVPAAAAPAPTAIPMSTPTVAEPTTGETRAVPTNTANIPTFATRPVEVPLASESSHDDDDDSDVVDDPENPYAPPITAGTVRRRTGTETEEE